MSCLLISDDLERSAPVAKRLRRWLPVRSIALSDYSARNIRDALFLVIDIDLTEQESVRKFRSNPALASSKKEKVFVTRKQLPVEIYQANALGALVTLPLDFGRSDIVQIIELCGGTGDTKRPRSVPVATAKAIERSEDVYDSFLRAAASKGPLPKSDIISSCDEVAECLKTDSVGSWLEMVRRHDGYTYRHCMTVYGLAVAFALRLGMRHADVQRIATGALLHDIGKVRIPLAILDKPGKLSPEERLEINKHPGYGAEILRKDGQFSGEVVEIALHHHELLDGSGYPDGLQADAISDPVRIMTIVDIFSALIDKRSYKEPIPVEVAYQMLLDMDGKLDKAILTAFRPVAFEALTPGRIAA